MYYASTVDNVLTPCLFLRHESKVQTMK